MFDLFDIIQVRFSIDSERNSIWYLRVVKASKYLT